MLLLLLLVVLLLYPTEHNSSHRHNIFQFRFCSCELHSYGIDSRGPIRDGALCAGRHWVPPFLLFTG